MKKFRISLTHKVLAAFFIAVLPVFLVFMASYENTRRHMEKTLFEEIRTIAEDREAFIYLLMDSLKNRMEDFSTDGFIRTEFEKMLDKRTNGISLSDSRPLNEYLLYQKLQILKYIYSFSIIAPDGKVLASTFSDHVGEDFSKYEFFLRGKKEVTVLDNFTGWLGLPEVVVSAPLYSLKSGKLIGVIAGFVLVEEFREIFTGERITELGAISFRVRKTLETYLVNRNKQMITESRFIEKAVMRQMVDTLPVRACLEEKRELTGVYTDYRGERVLGASMCLPELEWVLLAEIDESEALETIFQMRAYTFSTVIALLVVLTALYLYFQRIVISQLKRLASSAGEVASGNYDISVPVKSSDEVGILSESFNNMVFDLKKRTLELEESRNHMAAIIDNTPDFVYLKDIEERHILVNRRFEEVFKKPKADFLGKTVFDFLPRKYAEAIHRCDLQVLASAAPIGFEELVQLPDGVHVFYSVKTAVRDADGRVYALCGVSMDITGMKRAEAEIRRLNRRLEKKVSERTAELAAANDQLAFANKELEAFSYSAAHDLRAPLRVINGISSIISQDYGDKLDEQGLKLFDLIISETSRMDRLIDDLLQFSRATKMELKRGTVDLSAVADAIADKLKYAHPEREVSFSIEQGLKSLGDENLLAIVLENLLGNALKFTKNTAQARIEVGKRGMEGGKAVIYVKDNGAGFNMNQSQRLFEPFQRLHPHEEFPGTGLGLATVARIIRRHGGRVWAEGEPGKGAVFYFTIESA